MRWEGKQTSSCRKTLNGKVLSVSETGVERVAMQVCVCACVCMYAFVCVCVRVRGSGVELSIQRERYPLSLDALHRLYLTEHCMKFITDISCSAITLSHLQRELSLAGVSTVPTQSAATDMFIQTVTTAKVTRVFIPMNLIIQMAAACLYSLQLCLQRKWNKKHVLFYQYVLRNSFF